MRASPQKSDKLEPRRRGGTFENRPRERVRGLSGASERRERARDLDGRGLVSLHG
jgi:hypothetical protein